jgi:cysteine desulfurase
VATLDHALVESAYLDHAATTALRPEAFTAMTAELAETGNASSLHAAGRRARRVVEESRESIAADLHVRPSDIVFTSGGTESDNLAIKGLYWMRSAADPRRSMIVTSSVEHHAVLDAAGWLARRGARHVLLPVNSTGRVDPGQLWELLQRDAGQLALVSIMWANNETGTIQPVTELAQMCADHEVPFHVDGVQAAGWLDAPGTWPNPADVMSLSAHKLGGPLGVGCLIVSAAKLQPLQHGGGQELDIRSGTLMTPQIAGFAAALRSARESGEETVRQLASLRLALIERVQRLVPDAAVNGALAPHSLPNIASISFPGCEADALLMLLDARRIHCSAGSACTAGVARPSHVLTAMGADDAAARSTLRFSLGWNSTIAEVDLLATHLPDAVARARRATAHSARPDRFGAGS